ncbi:MAG TPA: DUF4136 domain-containing protein [Steroidobacteraceae bacterium]|jgi:hypothetical protein|nr:DUF4136 domain-containing protein [Steroidobacteraceae bacterium]
MSNRQLLSLAVAGALAVGVCACTTIPVRTDANPNLSVAMCHTYAFAPEHVANADQPAAYGNPLNAERLRTAIESNLSAKGLQRVERANADCVVGYAMGSRQVFNDYYAGFGPGWGGGWGRHGGFYGAWGWDYPYVSDETRIAVDIFDAKSRTPIWHAAASQNVSDLTGPQAEAKISAGTAAIFAKYPLAVPLPAGSGRAT